MLAFFDFCWKFLKRKVRFMTSGQRIYKCRKTKKLSQQYVADMLGVSRQAVSKWENDTSIPDTVHYINLAKIFGVSVEYLAFGELELAIPLDDSLDEAKNADAPAAHTTNYKEESGEKGQKPILALISGGLVLIIGAAIFVYAMFFTDSLFALALSILFIILGKRIAFD